MPASTAAFEPRDLKTRHWDAAYKAIAEHPALSKNTRCALWIETIGRAVLNAEPAPLADTVERLRTDRKHDVKRLRCYTFAVCLAELALAGNEQAGSAFKAVSPMLRDPLVTKRQIKEAALAASGGAFGRHGDPYQDAARGAA